MKHLARYNFEQRLKVVELPVYADHCQRDGTLCRSRETFDSLATMNNLLNEIDCCWVCFVSSDFDQTSPCPREGNEIRLSTSKKTITHDLNTIGTRKTVIVMVLIPDVLLAT